MFNCHRFAIVGYGDTHFHCPTHRKQILHTSFYNHQPIAGSSVLGGGFGAAYPVDSWEVVSEYIGESDHGLPSDTLFRVLILELSE